MEVGHSVLVNLSAKTSLGMLNLLVYVSPLSLSLSCKMSSITETFAGTAISGENTSLRCKAYLNKSKILIQSRT